MSIRKVSNSQQPKSRHPDWTKIYQQLQGFEIPWHSEKLDSNFSEHLSEQVKGSLLDIGCGLGSQAYALANLGFNVTGIDVSAEAIGQAEVNYHHSDLKFLVKDIFSDSSIESYDFVCDRGLLHVLSQSKIPQYVKYLSQKTKKSGHLVLKCFSSENEDPGFGPELYSKKDLEIIFSNQFELITCKQTSYSGAQGNGPKALFCIFERIKS